ncbi:hypothetical protein [Terasakiella pusilla]|uniref:hypothetical protein n=1 Tax=Terasakiella pusilla TaxID=64973 RepID=UPI003AA875CF
MQGEIFNAADWVYVPDGMGRLGKGYYKHKRKPSQTLTVAAFERKRAETSSKGSVESEQNINNFTQSAGGERLSTGKGTSPETAEHSLTPWDNPVYGEQSATARKRPVVKEEATATQGQAKTQPQEKVAKPPAPAPQQPENKESNGTGSESGAGSEGTVICTELHRRGLMSLRDYHDSHLYATTRLPASFMRGYQFWAVPYVAVMKRFEWAVAFIHPFVRWRTCEILYRLGRTPRGSYRGKILCALHDRLCTALGAFLSRRTPEGGQNHAEAVYG